mmetsp:Transcript_139937/g.447549  ORF Transcript_139937/g.447549 Transcript_139937/m.447549 type:complete len:441 (-) Transcript_139937:30-1352(-)
MPVGEPIPGLSKTRVLALLLNLLDQVHPEGRGEISQEAQDEVPAEVLRVPRGHASPRDRGRVHVAEIVPTIEDLLRRVQALVALHQLQQPPQQAVLFVRAPAGAVPGASPTSGSSSRRRRPRPRPGPRRRGMRRTRGRRARCPRGRRRCGRRRADGRRPPLHRCRITDAAAAAASAETAIAASAKAAAAEAAADVGGSAGRQAAASFGAITKATTVRQRRIDAGGQAREVELEVVDDRCELVALARVVLQSHGDEGQKEGGVQQIGIPNGLCAAISMRCVRITEALPRRVGLRGGIGLNLLHEKDPEVARQILQEESIDQLLARQLGVTSRPSVQLRGIGIAEIVPACEDLLWRCQTLVSLHQLQQPQEPPMVQVQATATTTAAATTPSTALSALSTFGSGALGCTASSSSPGALAGGAAMHPAAAAFEGVERRRPLPRR